MKYSDKSFHSFSLWVAEKGLTDLENLPGPDILVNEIIENLESGLNSFREIIMEDN